MSSIHEKPVDPTSFQATGKADLGAIGEKRVSRILSRPLTVLINKVGLPIAAFMQKMRGRSSSAPTPVSAHETVRVTVERKPRAQSAPPKLELSDDEKKERAVEALQGIYPKELLDHLKDRINLKRTDYPATAQLKDLADKFIKDVVTEDIREKVKRDIDDKIRKDPTFKTPKDVAYNNHPDIVKELHAKLPKALLDDVLDQIPENQRVQGGYEHAQDIDILYQKFIKPEG